jgi:hypothetical protein
LFTLVGIAGEDDVDAPDLNEPFSLSFSCRLSLPSLSLVIFGRGAASGGCGAS